MATIKLSDGRGELYQWDTGRKVVIDDETIKQVHYQNRFYGRTIDVDVSNGVAIIPDQLLQSFAPLVVFAWAGSAEDGYTKIEKTFEVHKRNKPADYVFTPVDQKTLDDLQRQIGDLGDLTTEAKENLVAAINEVALAGGAGSMDLRVADGYIQYSADGGMTWTNLIAMADLKGAKGDPGKTPVKGTDYWTESDKAEIVHDIHPAFYIDLAGDYPNYTCQVAMDDIKAAYNSGYNLVCRCTLAAYTATLPLFIPIAAANTWIFSGSGALNRMEFKAQSFTVAITANGVVAENTRLARGDGTLPNPSPIRIKVGDTTYIYNGSEPVDVTIDDGTEVSY